MAHSNVKSEWVDGNLVFKDKDGNEIFTIDGYNRRFTVPVGSELDIDGDLSAVIEKDVIVQNKRIRSTAAEVNAGNEVLPAVAGHQYRIVDWTMIAIGGNAATATSVDLVATQGASTVRPAVVAVAALTRSTAVKPNSSNVTLLADGASHSLLDENTGVSISKQSGGSNLATATAIDLIISYTLEAA